MANKKVQAAVILLVLIALPILVTRWISHSARRQDARDDELEAKFECNPPSTCVADFNGDGAADRVEVTDNLSSRKLFLSVISNGRELLRLPYDHTDGTLRTHTAISNDSGQPRLLIYDGASYVTPLHAAFGWNGERMVETPPSDLEREVISAMAAHDDTGGWNERAFRKLYTLAALTAYYLLLAVVTGAIIYRRFRRQRIETAV